MAERLVTGRPRHFPHLGAWLGVGLLRNLRGLLAALVATWFYVPFAVFVAVASALILGLVGFFGGVFADWSDGPEMLFTVPVVGPMLEAVLPRTGGVIGGLAGVASGLVFGFFGALLLFWVVAFEQSLLGGVGSLLGVVVFGLLIGLAYTAYRVVAEAVLLRASGARPPSRREREFLLPILAGCAHTMRLPNHPPVLVDDGRAPFAVAHTRYLVVSRGLLERLRYEPDVVAGVLAHGLVHWRNGDALSATFVRGVALPLYLIYAAVTWLRERVGHPLVVGLLWLVFWPVLVTVRFLVLPAQAADVRRQEYRADQGAVLAGHRDGLRRALTWLDDTFEGGHNGWTRALCAAHPAVEVRLERLEDPTRHYPLADPDGAGVPAAAGS